MEPSTVIELLGIEIEQIDSALEFWLAASFAVIIASHFARSTLNARLRATMTILYSLVTAIAVFRTMGDVQQLSFLGQYLERANIELPTLYSGVAMILRFILYLLGSVATLMYIFYDGSGPHDAKP